jgi:hypothetical protein
MTRITVNAKAPWPKSWDGKRAQKCDRFGNPDLRGRFIYWYEKQDGFEIKKIARLQYPERKQESLDTAKMKEELLTNPRYDMRLPKTKVRMRQRITSVYCRLGVQLIDAHNITHITTDVDTACWGTSGEEEYILINPYLVAQRKTFLTFIVQHEVMHRALYRGRRHLKDKELLNVVLDACIHRILSSTTTGKPSRSWQRFCEWIYPEESKKTILAICNASLTEHDLRELAKVNPEYVRIWNEFYGVYTSEDFEEITNPTTGRVRKKKLTGQYVRKIKDTNPDDLYFRLVRQLNNADREALEAFHVMGKDVTSGLNPFGDINVETITNGKSVTLRAEGADIAPEVSKRIEETIRKSLVPKRFRHGINWRNWCDARTEFWDKWVKKPEDLHDEDLAKYARRIRTEKMLDDVAGKIRRTFANDIVSQPYPNILTEDGTIMAIMGFRPPKWPFFSNYEGIMGRRRIVAFFDMSPSTYLFWPYMVRMIDTFENDFDLVMSRNNHGDPGAVLFAGSIKELTKQEMQKMRRGHIETGKSTCFNEIVDYAVKKIYTDDVDAVVTFTDGESTVSQDRIDMFNACGKKMYNIYFVAETPTLRNSGYRIVSKLDELNGESFTLIVSPSDHLDW